MKHFNKRPGSSQDAHIKYPSSETNYNTRSLYVRNFLATALAKVTNNYIKAFYTSKKKAGTNA